MKYSKLEEISLSKLTVESVTFEHQESQWSITHPSLAVASTGEQRPAIPAPTQWHFSRWCCQSSWSILQPTFPYLPPDHRHRPLNTTGYITGSAWAGCPPPGGSHLLTCTPVVPWVAAVLEQKPASEPSTCTCAQQRFQRSPPQLLSGPSYPDRFSWRMTTAGRRSFPQARQNLGRHTVLLLPLNLFW